MLLGFLPALLLAAVNLVCERMIRRRQVRGPLLLPWIVLTVVSLAAALVWLRLYPQQVQSVPWLQWLVLGCAVIAIVLELVRLRSALRVTSTSAGD